MLKESPPCNTLLPAAQCSEGGSTSTGLSPPTRKTLTGGGGAYPDGMGPKILALNLPHRAGERFGFVLLALKLMFVGSQPSA
jgi:hypothetical protein